MQAGRRKQPPACWPTSGRRLSAAADPHWRAALEDAAEREAEVLRAWLQPLPIAQLQIPRAWDAPRAVAALADRLGTDR